MTPDNPAQEIVLPSGLYFMELSESRKPLTGEAGKSVPATITNFGALFGFRHFRAVSHIPKTIRANNLRVWS